MAAAQPTVLTATQWAPELRTITCLITGKDILEHTEQVEPSDCPVHAVGAVGRHVVSARCSMLDGQQSCRNLPLTLVLKRWQSVRSSGAMRLIALEGLSAGDDRGGERSRNGIFS